MHYLFKHVLLRDVAYDIQMRSRLRELHRRAAEAIETLYADDLAPYYADLAYHYGQAELDEQERRYAFLAGKQAASEYANEAAVRLLSRALELTPQSDREGLVSDLECARAGVRPARLSRATAAGSPDASGLRPGREQGQNDPAPGTVR